MNRDELSEFFQSRMGSEVDEAVIDNAMAYLMENEMWVDNLVEEARKINMSLAEEIDGRVFIDLGLVMSTVTGFMGGIEAGEEVSAFDILWGMRNLMAAAFKSLGKDVQT